MGLAKKLTIAPGRSVVRASRRARSEHYPAAYGSGHPADPGVEERRLCGIGRIPAASARKSLVAAGTETGLPSGARAGGRDDALALASMRWTTRSGCTTRRS